MQLDTKREIPSRFYNCQQLEMKGNGWKSIPAKTFEKLLLKKVNNDQDGGWEIEHEKKRIFSNYVNLQTSKSISASFKNRM